MERCGERAKKSKLLKEKVFLIKVEGFLVLSSCVCQFCQNFGFSGPFGTSEVGRFLLSAFLLILIAIKIGAKKKKWP